MGGIVAADEPPTLEALLAWATAVAGERVLEVQKLSFGASRAMYVLRLDGAPDLVLRVDAGGGPLAGTDLNLKREAELYRALSPHYGKMPRFVAMHPSDTAFLMTRADGDHDLAALEPKERASVCHQFVEALAQLHRIDAAALDLPSFRRPEAPRDHALMELDFSTGMLRACDPDEVALGLCAVSILRSCAPPWDHSPVLCHGDAGPKNFMFDKGRITALIDWELAHLGDPHDDLAWWVFRGHEWLGAPGDLADQLRAWSARSGMAVDPSRLAWYRALVILRFYVTARAALRNGAAPEDRLLLLSLLPLLDIKLAHAAAGLLGHDLPDASPPSLEAPLGEAASSALSELLAADLAASGDIAEARRRAASAKGYLEHLVAVDCYGADIRRRDAAEQEDLLRRFGPFRGDEATRAHQIALLTGAASRGGRHAHLWPQTLARALSRPWSPDRLRSAMSVQA